MPETTYAFPDTPDPTGSTTPAGHGWVDTVWAQIAGVVTQIPDAAWYGLAGTVIAAGLISSIRIALGARNSTRRVKSDKFLTFLAAGVATGVVATGMWKFFGDVLHIANPYARVALFAFFEIAMLASAFRSRRFRLDRAAKRATEEGHDENRIDVDGIAVWVLATLSGLFAAADETTTAGMAVRVIAPLLAAWMWERGLAGELMQFTRGTKRLNLRLTPERVLVWLGIAEPSGREIGEVARKRRIALFARTAYRLNLLVENKNDGWRLEWTRWRLRRQTEAANEHLKLATDPALLAEIRAQLALLYGVEAGTSRQAVADLKPLSPPVRRELASTPFAPPTEALDGEPAHDATIATGDASVIAIQAPVEDASPDDIEPATDEADRIVTQNATDAAKSGAPKPARRRAISAATEGAHPTAVKLAKLLAKYPAETNSELAKRMRVGDRTVSRYRADAEAFNARQNGTDRPSIPETFPLPEPASTGAVNGARFDHQEN